MKRGNKYIIIAIILALELSVNIAGAAQIKSNEEVLFFINKNSCISGDTIRVKTYLATPGAETHSRIIHIQLDNAQNQHITKSIIKTNGKKGHGYIVIPDSCSTGPYFLRAFTNLQKRSNKKEVVEQSLMVYNRFEEEPGTINLYRHETVVSKGPSKPFGIKTNKPSYNTRDEVIAEFSIPQPIQGQLADVIVSARLANHLTDMSITGAIQAVPFEINTPENLVIEKNGLVISGTVSDAETKLPAPGVPVFLSIADSIPYFDYYYSDINGNFNFYMKGLYGLADLILQTAPIKGKSFIIELTQNYIECSKKPKTETLKVNSNQAIYIENLVKAARFRRYFNPAGISFKRTFIKPPRAEHPFYGKPTSTVYTHDYIGLPNFNEISRELLMGSRWRERKDTVILKMLNLTERDYFPNEPFKLLDGIPIFDLKLFADKNSETINRIDLVAKKRIFGDMVFNGVLAVYSKIIDLNWVSAIPGLYRFDFQAIQINQGKTTGQPSGAAHSNIPDLRDVLLWERIEKPKETHNLKFRVSDLKGKYIITVYAITSNGEVYTESCTFNVER